MIGVGANVGDKLETMREALRRIALVAHVEATSRVYETAPVGVVDQPSYFNAAVRVSWRGTPEALLVALLAIEASLGRVRRERWAPRTIDLDVLWIDGVTVASETLDVPHPRLTERAFALVPLLEVAPTAIDPRTGAVYMAPAYGADSVRPTEHVL